MLARSHGKEKIEISVVRSDPRAIQPHLRRYVTLQALGMIFILNDLHEGLARLRLHHMLAGLFFDVEMKAALPTGRLRVSQCRWIQRKYGKNEKEYYEEGSHLASRAGDSRATDARSQKMAREPLSAWGAPPRLFCAARQRGA